MDIELVISNLVDVAEKAIALDKPMKDAGYDDNPYFTIYGHIADALYHLIGEKTNMFDDSITYCILNNSDLDHNSRVQIFLTAYKAKNPS